MRLERQAARICCFEALDDSVDAGQLAHRLRELAAEIGDSSIELDLSGVPRANSIGILFLIRALRVIGRPITYVNAPFWLVAQFNMIAEFLPPGFSVKSFECPYSSPLTHESMYRVVQVGKDVPLRESYDDYEAESILVNGVPFEPDFDPQEYLCFLSGLAERSRAA